MPAASDIFDPSPVVKAMLPSVSKEMYEAPRMDQRVDMRTET